jgi:hypothetical protein
MDVQAEWEKKLNEIFDASIVPNVPREYIVTVIGTDEDLKTVRDALRARHVHFLENAHGYGINVTMRSFRGRVDNKMVDGVIYSVDRHTIYDTLRMPEGKFDQRFFVMNFPLKTAYGGQVRARLPESQPSQLDLPNSQPFATSPAGDPVIDAPAADEPAVSPDTQPPADEPADEPAVEPADEPAVQEDAMVIEQFTTPQYEPVTSEYQPATPFDPTYGGGSQASQPLNADLFEFDPASQVGPFSQGETSESQSEQPVFADQSQDVVSNRAEDAYTGRPEFTNERSDLPADEPESEVAPRTGRTIQKSVAPRTQRITVIHDESLPRARTAPVEIPDTYDEYRRRWTANKDDDELPAAASGLKIDNVMTETEHDRLMQHKAYTEYARPLIAKYAAPLTPTLYEGPDLIESWVPLKKHDRMYAGFVAAKVVERCIMHAGLTQASYQIINANSMARTWVNACMGIYAGDAAAAIVKVRGDIIEAGMTMIEAETAMLSTLTGVLRLLYNDDYRTDLIEHMVTSIDDYITPADLLIYKELPNLKDAEKFLPREQFVDGVFQQCMHDAAAQFFADAAARRPMALREVPLRIYLGLPPGFWDIPLFGRDEHLEEKQEAMRERVRQRLESGARYALTEEEEEDRARARDYARILSTDKMLRQNVEFAPLTQCAVPAPRFEWVNDGLNRVNYEDEDGFPLPETIKWPLLHFRYVFQNTDFSLPHSSWHNSRMARSLRWQAFVRMVYAILNTPDVLSDGSKIYEWPSQLNMHDPMNNNAARHGVRVFPQYIYKNRDVTSPQKGVVDNNEVVLTTVINLSYDRTFKSNWPTTENDPEVRVAPGDMHIYQRNTDPSKNRRLIAQKHTDNEVMADTSPFPYMQCSIVVVKEPGKNPDSLTRLAVENGNMLQIGGVFKNHLYKGTQSYTDRGDYVHFMIKPRGVIESPLIYPIFRDNRLFLQRPAFYRVFNMPTIIAKPKPVQRDEDVNPFEAFGRGAPQPAGAHFNIPYMPLPMYSDKAYKSFDTQRVAVGTVPGKEVHEVVRGVSEPQTALKPNDAMYLPTKNKEELTYEFNTRGLIPELLYPLVFPPTRSFFGLEGFTSAYDEAILMDLVGVSEYEIARMMGGVRLNKSYVKRTAEAYERLSKQK